MKRVKHQIIMEYTYETREERDIHVTLMTSQGWESSGKVRRLKDGVSIWHSDDENNHEWFADFWKYEF